MLNGIVSDLGAVVEAITLPIVVEIHVFLIKVIPHSVAEHLM